MFSLAYPLTEKVEIGGIEYPLDMSFDNVLRLIDMLSDQVLSDVAQVETGILMLLGEIDCGLNEKSEILNALFEKLIAKDAKESQVFDIAGNPMPSAEDEKEISYSLVEDAEYIYSSFYQAYKMDLIDYQGKLHWDKFKALLGGLPDDCIFKQIVDIRTRKLPIGKGTAKERENLIKLKKQYALKGTVIKEDDDDES